jgi:hypothetical protein
MMIRLQQWIGIRTSKKKTKIERFENHRPCTYHTKKSTYLPIMWTYRNIGCRRTNMVFFLLLC